MRRASDKWVQAYALLGNVWSATVPDASTGARPAQVVRSTILEYDRDGDGRLDLQEFSQLISQADLDACILP